MEFQSWMIPVGAVAVSCSIIVYLVKRFAAGRASPELSAALASDYDASRFTGGQIVALEEGGEGLNNRRYHLKPGEALSDSLIDHDISLSIANTNANIGQHPSSADLDGESKSEIESLRNELARLRAERGSDSVRLLVELQQMKHSHNALENLVSDVMHHVKTILSLHSVPPYTSIPRDEAPFPSPRSPHLSVFPSPRSPHLSTRRFPSPRSAHLSSPHLPSSQLSGGLLFSGGFNDTSPLDSLATRQSRSPPQHTATNTGKAVGQGESVARVSLELLSTSWLDKTKQTPKIMTDRSKERLKAPAINRKTDSGIPQQVALEQGRVEDSSENSRDRTISDMDHIEFRRKAAVASAAASSRIRSPRADSDPMGSREDSQNTESRQLRVSGALSMVCRGDAPDQTPRSSEHPGSTSDDLKSFMLVSPRALQTLSELPGGFDLWERSVDECLAMKLLPVNSGLVQAEDSKHASPQSQMEPEAPDDEIQLLEGTENEFSLEDPARPATPFSADMHEAKGSGRTRSFSKTEKRTGLDSIGRMRVSKAVSSCSDVVSVARKHDLVEVPGLSRSRARIL
jgi:hypothetical protein